MKRFFGGVALVGFAVVCLVNVGCLVYAIVR